MRSRWCSSPAPARRRSFNGGREEGAPPWPRVERERVGESEEVRESRGRRFLGGVGLG